MGSIINGLQEGDEHPNHCSSTKVYQ